MDSTGPVVSREFPGGSRIVLRGDGSLRHNRVLGDRLTPGFPSCLKRLLEITDGETASSWNRDRSSLDHVSAPLGARRAHDA